jgi:hypothetical protein
MHVCEYAYDVALFTCDRPTFAEVVERLKAMEIARLPSGGAGQEQQ